MSAPSSSSRGIIRARSFPSSSSSCIVVPCVEVTATMPIASSASSIHYESSLSSSYGQGRGEEEDGTSNDGVGSTDIRRRQSQGPTTTTASANNNVGELVAKAKKAAASLWMILHAQNCRLPEDKCMHRGCHDTRLLLVHVKACPAGCSPDFPCPTHTRGCNETRKLLAHYRKCRDIRNRQQVGLLGRRSQQQQPQPDHGSCLICSLVARRARGMMDRTTNTVGGGVIRGKDASVPSSYHDARFGVEGGSADPYSHAYDRAPAPRVTPSFERTPSMTLMPPPPPRYGSCPSASTTSRLLSNESFESSHFLPPRSMQSNIPPHAAVAMHPANASDENGGTRSSDDASPSGSVDSSIRTTFSILRRHPEERLEPADDEMIVPGPNVAGDATAAPSRRRRSESYDERQTRVKFAPVIVDGCESRALDERGGGDYGINIGNSARPRSASCHSDATKTAMSATSHGFDAIVEEGAVNCEEPMFSID